MSREPGIRLYYLRTHRTTYTQAEVARLIGTERSTYTKYENGRTEPSLQTLAKLKEVLSAEYAELLEIRLTEEEIADYAIMKKIKKRKRIGS